jgi:hypothetical protein
MKKKIAKKATPATVGTKKTRVATKAPAAKKTSSSKTKSRSKDENEDLPGYPYYPSSEDIMNSSKEKLGLDIENPDAPLVLNENTGVETPSTNDSPDFVKGTNADVTKDELEDLGSDELAMDMGDDEDLKDRLFPVDMEGSDLIVPGAELDDEQEEIGNEDEENNFYSHADN